MNRPVAAALALFLSAAAWADVRVAVVPFDNAGGEEFEGLSVGLQSMVTTDLSQAESITVVERAKLQDLLGEMQLAKDGVIDPKTAVEIGKVAGATHVVAGSFTVVGDTMRLDARVADVKTGKVSAATEMSGERDAFFELEKDLVKKLIAEMGATLTPKERAAVGRLHTADFDSFKQFSEGIALFDADRYAEAVSVLQGVTEADQDFKLASLTLDDIREVQKLAETKARAAAIANAEEDFAIFQENAKAEAEILEKVRAIADDTSRDWQHRATANLLIVSMTGAQMKTGRLSTLEDATDEWALHRMGERAFQAFWNDVRPRAPEFIPVFRSMWTGFDNDRYTFDEHMEANLKRFFTGTNPNFLLSSCQKAVLGVGEDELEMLWVPRVRQLEMQAELLDVAGDCIDTDKRFRALEDIAEDLTREGRISESSALLKRLAAASQDERFLQSVAANAKRNAEKLAAIEQFPVGSMEREILLYKMRSVVSVKQLKSDPDGIPSDVHYYVRRKFPHIQPMFVSGIPMWVIPRDNENQLATGRRTARDETNALRHYQDARRYESYGVGEQTRPTFLVSGGVPRGDVTLGVTLDFTPADDWWPPMFRRTPKGWTPLPDRPTAGLVFAAREIETAPICDPVDPTKMTPVPTTAVGVLVHDGHLVIAELEETYPEADRCRMSPNQLRDLEIKTVLAKKPLKAKSKVALTATMNGTTLTAQAGSTKVSTTLDRKRTGFTGLFADGLGYVELSEPSIE